jgi:hypothetical protein
MVVDNKDYEAHIQAFKDKGFNTWERGGDYHSGFDVDTCIFVNNEAFCIECCAPKLSGSPTYTTYYHDMLDAA